MAADGETIGELEVRGPRPSCDGYLNRPDATAALLHRRRLVPHRRRGLHRRATGGTASSAAQSTDLIKTGGYRVGAGEVEAALLAHPAVPEAAVVGEPDDDLGQAIVAYVVADGVTGAELTDFVARDALGAQAAPPGRARRGAAPQRHGQGAEGRSVAESPGARR